MARNLLFVTMGLCVLAVAGSASADLVLVENGQARAQVVVAETAPPLVRDAAVDFVRVVKRVSGAELALVVESKSDPAAPRVIIGACNVPPGLEADPAVIRGDEAYAGYVVACGRNVLTLAGLIQSLEREDAGWQKSIMEDPIVDHWYKAGARPTVRAQWRSAVQNGLVEGLQTLSGWYQTAEGGKASAEERHALDQLTTSPQTALLWQALQGTLQRGPNLLPNPGFEESKSGEPGPAGPEWQTAGVAAGWSTWKKVQNKGKFFLDASVKHSGNSAGAFKGGECLCYITTVPIEVGKTYLAEVWAMAPAVRENTKVTLDVRWRDAQGRWYSGAANHRVATKSSGAWERLLIPFVAPKGAPRAVVLLVGEGIEKQDVVRYDDTFLGEVTTGQAAEPGAPQP